MSPAVEEIDSGSPLPKIVGGTPSPTAKLAGLEVECLVDTGSVVSLVSETFYKRWSTRQGQDANSARC